MRFIGKDVADNSSHSNSPRADPNLSSKQIPELLSQISGLVVASQNKGLLNCTARDTALKHNRSPPILFCIVASETSHHVFLFSGFPCES